MKKLNLLKLFILIITSFYIVNLKAYTVTADVVNEKTLTIDYSKYGNFKEQEAGGTKLPNAYNLDDGNLDIILSYPCEKLEFKASTTKFIAWGRAKVAVDASYNESQNDWSDAKNIFNSSGNYFTGANNQQTVTDFNKTEKKVAIKNTYNGTFASSGKYINDIKFTIAPHIRLNTPTNNNLGEVMIGGTKSIDINFNSFLTSGNLTVITDNNNFLLNGKDTKITLCEGNTLKKLNENTKNFQVVYSAKTAGVETANITITDEGNQNSVTIKLTATCIKKTNAINWNNINTQIPVGESISLSKVTSTSKSKITFISSDTTKIKVENNQLVALAEGTATITAQVAETDEYQAIEATLDFEATEKTIQNIVWDQNFYLLKLGDADITLDAYTVDKETQKPNDLTIEYSSANTNIVTVDNGVLHIVGKGQTTITAHQRGNDQYAGIYMTKMVIIREVSSGCENNLAIDAPDKIEKGNDNIGINGGGWDWSPIEVEHELSTVGENLSFVVSCSDTGTENFGDTGGARLVITDQENNEIYNGKGNNQSKTIKINRSVRKLKFKLTCNLTKSISQILVTPAIYFETTTDTVKFNGAEIGRISSADVNFNWANQPDMMWATIENDETNTFSVDQNSYIFGGSCGDYGSSSVKVLFTPQKDSLYTANLVIYLGEGENMKKMTTIPISGKAIKTPQVITWNQDIVALNPTQGATYELEATASSNLPVYYTSSNENIVRIENNKFIVVGAGEVTITAKQDGNLNYEPATPVSKTITIAKLDQTISWNQEFAADLTIGNIIELSAVASSGDVVAFSSSNEAVATISGNVLTIVGIGETTITASQAGNNNYNAAANVAKTLSIAKLNQTITWNQDLAGLMIGNTETLNATASSGLEITYSSDNDAVASINGSTITVNSDGTVTITATQAGNDTYNATSIEKTFTFGRTTQTITWNDDLSTLKINDVITLTATSDAGLEITYTIDNSAVATIEGNTLTIIGAGEANITAQQAGNETHNSASVIKTINIEHLTQTIDWKQDLSSLTLESETIELNAVATSGLDIVYSSSNTAVATIEGNTLTIVGAGETTITARQVGNNQYTPAEITQTLNISKLSQTIVWEQNLNDITLLENFFELTAEATSGLIVTYTSSNEAVAQINGNILSIIGEGEAIITATQLGNEKYDAADAIEKSIVIEKQSQEIIWDQIFTDLDMYDNPYELTAYATSGLTVTYELAEEDEGSAVIKDNYLYPNAAGNITIYAYQEGNEFYKKAQFVEKTVYVNSKEIAVDVENTVTTTILYTDNIVYFNGEHNTLRVFDMTGRMIYSANVEDENSHYLPISQRGIYVICLDNQSLKIVK